MSQGKTPRGFFAVFMTTAYRSFAEAAAQAPELITAHVARSKQLHSAGTLVTAGLFLDRPPRSP